MNKKLFSEAMTEVHDKYYEEAALYRRGRQKSVWVKRAAIAACLCLVVSGTGAFLGRGLLKMPTDAKRPSDSSDTGTADVSAHKKPETELAPLTVTDFENVGMGFEGYWAYDISELVNANPWNEKLELSTLPVYKNQLTYDVNFIATGADFDKMRAFLLEIADRFGLDTDTLTITDDVPDEKTQREIRAKYGGDVPDGCFNPTKLIARADGLEIEVGQNMTAKISFEPAVSLPAEYHFTDNASYEDTAKAAEYLKTEYKHVIAIDNPQVNIHGGDYRMYDIDAEQRCYEQYYTIAFYDAAGNAAEQIIHYNFNQVIFYCNDKGKLSLARICQPDLSEKIGDYPVISAEEAASLLSDGKYITTVPYEMPGTEYVKKVELIYLTSELEEYFMPYYRFYVELPEELEVLGNGLKTYGAYYVPAVDGAFLQNFPQHQQPLRGR